MLETFLWPVMAVWMGVALLFFGAIVGTIAWCSVHMLRDVIAGARGKVWCPTFRRDMRVIGVPRGSLVGVPFSALRHCERYGDGRIRCSRHCLLVAPG